MPLSKTWYTTANRAQDDVTTNVRVAASILFALKNFLTGGVSGTNGPEGARPSSAYWTVHSSSDGTTASAADNLGGATFTAAKWVRNTAGNAHSWYVLQSPATMTDGPWYLTVSMGTSTDQTANLSISKVAPSGGTTTADPTASPMSTYSSVTIAEASTNPGKCHFVTDADGNFWFFASRNSTAIAHLCLGVQTLTEARSSGDSARVILLHSQSASGRGGGQFLTTSQTWRGLTFDATAAASTSSAVGVATFAGAGIATANAIDGKIEAIPSGWVFDITASKSGLRGRIPDVWNVGTAPAVAAGNPTAANPTRVVIGTALFPMSVVPTL